MKTTGDPDIDRIYDEWFYRFGAISFTAEDHPFSEWARDNYPDIYKKMLDQSIQSSNENADNQQHH